jgi:LacI family transcriptional regulator
MSAKSKVTIQDIARYAGVSTATASKVLNSLPTGMTISDETRRGIFEAANKFNYAPSFLARSLRTRRTNTIGVIAFSLTGFYESLLIRYVNDAVLSQGLHAIFCGTEYRENLDAFYFELFTRQKVDGLIIVGCPSFMSTKWQRSESKSGRATPVVSINDYSDDDKLCTFNYDATQSGVLAAEHLLTKGHRRIALFRYEPASDVLIRAQRFQETCVAAGADIRPEWVISTKLNAELAYPIAKQLLQRTVRPEAIFANSDEAALGVVRAAADLGLRVPQDVAVLGHDNIPMGQWTTPRLSTISQPLAEMATQSVQTVLRLVNGETVESRRVLYRPQLIARESA